MDITKTDRGYSWTCPICRTHIDVELFGDGSNSKQMAERFKQDHEASGCSAAVTGARASLADVRLNWDDLCAPEDVR